MSVRVRDLRSLVAAGAALCALGASGSTALADETAPTGAPGLSVARSVVAPNNPDARRKLEFLLSDGVPAANLSKPKPVVRTGPGV